MYLKIVGKYLKDHKCRIQLCISGLCIASLMLFQACDDVIEDKDREANVSLDMRAVSVDVMSNISLYAFDDNYKFHHEQLNLIDKSNNVLFTYMDAGPWNLVMLGCNTNIYTGNSKVIPPVYGMPMSSSPMWQTKLKPGGEFLDETPELRYAPIPVVITANQDIHKNATLNRNVAMVRVILENHDGFDEVNATNSHHAYVDLLDVQTKLFWNGKLSQDPLDISDKPLRKYFVFNAAQVADVVEFIIPADIDAVESDKNNPATHKLRLKASMPINGEDFYGDSPFEIPFVPLPNGIIEIYLTFKGEPNTKLDVKVTVKDWGPYIYQTGTFE